MVNLDSTINTTGSWINAADAARLLGVKPATLYAYVSRGYVRSRETTSSTRARRYSRDDLEQLRRRVEERHDPQKAAQRSLDWGIPVLDSRISLIQGGMLHYRGHRADTLAQTRTVNEVASLIWTGDFAETQPPADTRRLARPWIPAVRRLPFIGAAQACLAVAAAHDPDTWREDSDGRLLVGWRVLQILRHVAAPASDARCPIEDVLAARWRTGRTGAGLIRQTLILCADHELNASSFTARCVASTGAHPYGAVIAGLASLEGPRHGGGAARVETLLREAALARSVRRLVSAQVRRGVAIDGFGHPLYREGDPRATALLASLGQRYEGSRRWRPVREVLLAAEDLTGERANLDFALAAIGWVLRLPRRSALTLFAMGRAIGWIGHALEQYELGGLIRPRARYVGEAPATSDSPG